MAVVLLAAKSAFSAAVSVKNSFPPAMNFLCKASSPANLANILRIFGQDLDAVSFLLATER